MSYSEQLSYEETEYYEETSPQKRLAILDAMEDSPENQLKRKLFKLRHPDRRLQNDFYMQCFLEFKYFTDQDSVPALSNKQKIRSDYEKMGSREAKAFGDGGDLLFYLEIRNAAKRYFETSAHKGQGRKWFGFMTPDDSQRKAYRAEEAWKMSIGLAHKYSMAEDLSVLIKAVTDAYSATEEEAVKLLDDYDKMHRPNRKNGLCSLPD